MEYSIRIGGFGGLWMPVPRTFVGQVVNITDIVPAPDDLFQDSNGNLIAFWEGRSATPQQYSIAFVAEFQSIIRKTLNPDLIAPYDTSSSIYQRYTQPSVLTQSDHQSIVQLAQQIVRGQTNPYHQARLVHEWVDANIRGGHITGSDCHWYSALGTLESRTGGCGGFNRLFVALLRSLGIPARTVGGLTTFRPDSYLPYFTDGDSEQDNLGTHVWSEFYLPGYGWIQCDATQASYFAAIYEPRLALFRGEDIQLGHGYPFGPLPLLVAPHTDLLLNSGGCPKTQTVGDGLTLLVERLDGPPPPMLPIIVDGESLDWGPYSPLATDPQGDTIGGLHTDMKAVYAEIGPNYVYFMVEMYDPPLPSEARIGLNATLLYDEGDSTEWETYANSDGSVWSWIDDDRAGPAARHDLYGVPMAWGNVLELQVESWRLGNPTGLRDIYARLLCDVNGEWTRADTIVQ